MRGLVVFLFQACTAVSLFGATHVASLRSAEACVEYRVVDDRGTAVSNATVHVWSRTDSPRLVIDEWVMTTDEDGRCKAFHETNERFSISVDKEGYYHTFDRVTFRSPKSGYEIVDGKWQPYGATRTVVLKRIKEPGKTIGFDDGRTRHAIPVWGQWIGFDLELGDWLPPYGKGRCEDVLLRFKSEMRKRPFDYTRSMEVSFTNNPFAGAYFMKKDETSILKSEYAARTNAAYLATLDFLQDSRPDKPMASKVLERDSYLVFRTRTRLDEKGRLVGAHYGKIYYWMWGEKDMSLSGGCFNPVENDPSIEGDTVLRREILRGHK